MPLPDAYRWSDSSDGSSHLYWNCACVAAIKPDGTTKLKWWQKEFHSKAAGVAQAKRFVERWINARNSPRAYECARWRAKYSKQQAERDTVRQYRESSSPGGILGDRSSSPSSSRVIKVDTVPDDFESIADVGQSLHPFAKSSGLNVKANSSDARPAQRGTVTVAQPCYGSYETYKVEPSPIFESRKPPCGKCM